ncbi:hypothetical protein LSAT2_032078 [Lamellibrachia satsuma]|nr:hypothetical protein LSAT2_032078 [Lamellibrachia satsuma]
MAMSKQKVEQISERLHKRPPASNDRGETPEQRFKAKSMSKKELDDFLRRHFWIEYHTLKQCCDKAVCDNPEECCKKNSSGKPGPLSQPKVCRKVKGRPSPLAKSMTKEEFADFMRRHFWVEYHKLKQCCDKAVCDNPETCCRQSTCRKANAMSTPKVCTKGPLAIVAADTISRPPVTKSELDALIQHFYETWTISSRPKEDMRRYVIKDEICKDPVDKDELTAITTRLHTTHTNSSNPENRFARKVCTNDIAKTPRSEDDMKVRKGRREGKKVCPNDIAKTPRSEDDLKVRKCAPTTSPRPRAQRKTERREGKKVCTNDIAKTPRVQRTTRSSLLALVGREEVGCASGSAGGRGGQWMIKCGEAMRGMLGRAHLSLGGGREEVRKTGRKETGRIEDDDREGDGSEGDWKEGDGGKATGAKASGVKSTGAQENQEMGGKGDIDGRARWRRDNMLPSDIAAGQNATEGIRCKSYSEVVIEGLRRRARAFVGDSIARKTDRAPNKGDDMVEIYDRLTATHTKSSAGGVECKPKDPAKIPGYGLKRNVEAPAPNLERRRKRRCFCRKRHLVHLLSANCRIEIVASKSARDQTFRSVVPSGLVEFHGRIKSVEKSSSTRITPYRRSSASRMLF